MLPIKFYIYGVPDGFDMLSGTLDDKSYFEMFYDTSKKGTELKVNRNINGETIYSYMVYDLVSCKGRPGAFFGMSVVFSNYEYCNDVRSLSELFTGVLQNVILKKEILLASGENGVVYFKVPRFKEQSDECNNIGEIIRFNIQEKLAHTIVRYDNTFTRNKEGRILTVPFNLPNTDFLQVFKDYVWVSFSTEKKIVTPPTTTGTTTGGISSGTCSNNDEQLSPDYLAGLRKKTGSYKDLIIEAFKGNSTKDSISSALKEVSSHLNVLREFARRQPGVSELKQDYESIYVDLEDRWKNMIGSPGTDPGSRTPPPPPPVGLWERFLKSKASKVAVILVFVAGLGYGAYKLVPKITSVFSNEKETVADIGSEKKGEQNDKSQDQESVVKPEVFSKDTLRSYIDKKDFIGADTYICSFDENKIEERRKILSEEIEYWYNIEKNQYPLTNDSSLLNLIEKNLPDYIRQEYIDKVDKENKVKESDQPSAVTRETQHSQSSSTGAAVLTLYTADVNYNEVQKLSENPVSCVVGDCFVIKSSSNKIGSYKIGNNKYLEIGGDKNKGRLTIYAKGATNAVKVTVDGTVFNFRIRQ